MNMDAMYKYDECYTHRKDLYAIQESIFINTNNIIPKYNTQC